jgi:hypothetical protein
VPRTIDRDHLNLLCPELRQVFDAEIAAGNRVVETRESWPNKGGLFVLLRDPFHSDSALADAVLFYTEWTPRDWKSHFCHLESKQILACGYGDSPKTAISPPNRTLAG